MKSSRMRSKASRMALSCKPGAKDSASQGPNKGCKRHWHEQVAPGCDPPESELLLRTERECAAAVGRRQRAHGERQEAGLLRRDDVRVAGGLRPSADAHLLCS